MHSLLHLHLLHLFHFVYMHIFSFSPATPVPSTRTVFSSYTCSTLRTCTVFSCYTCSKLCTCTVFSCYTCYACSTLCTCTFSPVSPATLVPICSTLCTCTIFSCYTCSKLCTCTVFSCYPCSKLCTCTVFSCYPCSSYVHAQSSPVTPVPRCVHAHSSPVAGYVHVLPSWSSSHGTSYPCGAQGGHRPEHVPTDPGWGHRLPTPCRASVDRSHEKEPEPGGGLWSHSSRWDRYVCTFASLQLS